MNDPGVALKFKRARHHLEAFTTGVSEYLDREPFEVTEHSEPDRGRASFRVHIREEPPADLGLVFGDAAHNARSALDHVACRLVEANGRTAERAKFPIGKNAGSFRDALRSGLDGAEATVKAAVRDLHIYPGGDDLLVTLHALDIADKHRVLTPVGMSFDAIQMSFGFKGLEMPFALAPKDVHYPVVEDMEIFGIEEQARFADKGGFTEDYKFVFSLAVDGLTTPEGRPTPAGPALTACIDHAEEVANRLLGLINRG